MSRAKKKENKVGVWEDPPPPRGPSYDWASIADALRSKPGEWLKVFEEDRASLVTAIRQGSISALRPTRGFEVRTTNNNRRESPRLCTLYVRYNPDADQGEEEQDGTADSDG